MQRKMVLTPSVLTPSKYSMIAPSYDTPLQSGRSKKIISTGFKKQVVNPKPDKTHLNTAE